MYFEYKTSKLHQESSYCDYLVIQCRKTRKMKKTAPNADEEHPQCGSGPAASST